MVGGDGMSNTVQDERLARYLKAEKAVLMGQSYTIGTRTLTRADLSTIRAAIDDLIAGGAQLEGAESAQTGRAKRIVFLG